MSESDTGVPLDPDDTPNAQPPLMLPVDEIPHRCAAEGLSLANDPPASAYPHPEREFIDANSTYEGGVSAERPVASPVTATARPVA